MLKLTSTEHLTVVRDFFGDLGLRCEALVLLGFIWALLGVGVLTNQSNPPDGLLFMLIPSTYRGVGWIVTGIIAIVAAWRSSGTSKALGGLVVMPVIRLVGYILGWIFWLLPGEQRGEYAAGWYQASYYFVMIGFVVFVSRIPPGILRRSDSPDKRRCERT